MNTFPRRVKIKLNSPILRYVSIDWRVWYIVDSRKHTCERHKTEHFNLYHHWQTPKRFLLSPACKRFFVFRLDGEHGYWLPNCIRRYGRAKFEGNFNEVNIFGKCLSAKKLKRRKTSLLAFNVPGREKKKRKLVKALDCNKKSGSNILKMPI